MKMGEGLEGRVENWRHELLDFSRRNPLLYCPEGEGLPLICSSPNALAGRLGGGEGVTVLSAAGGGGGGGVAGEGVVLTPLSEKALKGRAVEVYRRGREAVEEGGVETLYLAMGFLAWEAPDEAGGGTAFRAPMVLVPVSLARMGGRNPVVKITARDEEARFNAVLLEKLRRAFGMEIAGLDGGLPKPRDARGGEDSDEIDVEGVWGMVRRAVEGKGGVQVVGDVALGHFSVFRYWMWQDLRALARAGALRKSAVVRRLVDLSEGGAVGSAEAAAGGDSFPDGEEKPRELLLPLEADAAQAAAVARAAAGEDLVVVGPPGTGKSQTIANIIAHFVGTGKSALFVSDKTAALEAVRERLEAVGVGDFCLSLYAHETNRGVFAQKLMRVLNAAEEGGADGWGKMADELGEMRAQLNAYARQLHAPRANGISAYSAVGVAVRDAAVAREVGFGWETTCVHSAAQVDEMRGVARDLRARAGEVAWAEVGRGVKLIDHAEWSEEWQARAVARAEAFSEAVGDAVRLGRAMAEALGMAVPETMAQLAAAAVFAAALRDSHRLKLVGVLGEEGGGVIAALERAAAHLESYRECAGRLGQGGCSLEPATAWRELDGEAIARRWGEAEGAWFLVKWWRQMQIKRELRRGGVRGEVAPMRDAPILAELRREGAAVDALDGTLSGVGVRVWRGLDSEGADIRQFCAMGRRLREAAVGVGAEAGEGLRVAARWVEEAALAPDGAVGRAVRAYVAAYEGVAARGAELSDSVGQSVVAFFADDEVGRVAAVLAQVGEGDLRRWCGWAEGRRRAREVGVAALVEAIEDGRVAPEGVEAAFEAGYCAWWARALVTEEEGLRFGEGHGDFWGRFRRLEAAFAALTGRFIRDEAGGRVRARAASEAGAHSAALNVVRREARKSRGHKAIGALLAEAAGVVRTLSPCLMMSPGSVAQYLPAGGEVFDVVIVDEASRVAVGEAVGALARGRQAVVVGDPMQMSPAHGESVLAAVRATGVSESVLYSHYRSRREGLIRFSGRHYYEDRLVTFPEPDLRSGGGETGVFLEAVPAGEEARAIVRAVVQRLRDEALSALSIGVVTFSRAQQGLILDLLDAERSRHLMMKSRLPDIERFFEGGGEGGEPVFVKNVDAVQGDVRDVVFVCLAGWEEALARAGGERCLNVALTRARFEMRVFSAEGGGGARGDLRRFLAYAGGEGGSEGGAAVTAPVLAPLEEVVARRLREKGWEVHARVGKGGYRVDLGVVHPDAPGVYVAGVLCDGEGYGKMAGARERDGVRPAVLERQGWVLFRVWSVEWLADSERAFEALHEGLRGLCGGQSVRGGGE